MYNSQEIANNIKKHAKNAGISIKQLLEDCGLGINTVGKMSNGTDILSENLYKISERLDVSLDVLTGKEKKPPITENFTFEELEIINAYRNQPEAARRVVRRALGLEGISPDAATAAYGGKDTQIGKEME